MGQTHLGRNILAVGLGDDGVLVKDVVHELRGDSDFDFAALYCLWTGVDELAGLALFLGVCSGLGKEEVLVDM